MNRHTYIPETSQRFLAGPGVQPGLRAGANFPKSFDHHSSLLPSLCDASTPAASSSLLQLIPAPSSTPAAFRSLLQHPALLQLPALSCSFRHSCSFQLAPAVYSSPLRRFTDVPRPIPAPADDLIQCPLTSSARYRPDTVQTTSVFFTIHRLQIKTRFPSSTTDRLRLSSFFAIVISLPLCPPFSCTVDWHSHLSARCNKW
ncbi:unnamed protein product [Acanthosepion pharaonis]|uniref:Uncharacterized protein n=1 Tax=Acanthosepion pharaonis TaxID=158019 RepID=A0A812EIR3_ACAPH|nr:unnamed protein product [Sepia pharaonis]